MELSENNFITLVTSLIKDGRSAEAIEHIRKRIDSGNKTPSLYSLAGVANATNGYYAEAVPGFLFAYASTRHPFYLLQLEEALSKIYTDHFPYVLNSVDYISFFRERRAKLNKVELKSVTRMPPNLANQPPQVFDSTIFEEIFADRGIWCAEDRDLEILYASGYHSVPATDTSFLMDKLHEIPDAPSELFPGFNTAEGTLGIHSLHIGARTMLCRKTILPVHTIDEEAVFIGGSPNAGHFLLDFLPKAEIWAAARGDRDLPVYTYNISGFFREIAEALYPELRFVDLASLLPEKALLRFKHVHVPSYLTAGYAFPALRKRAEAFGHMKEENGAGDLVYLSRGEEFRRVVNENELIECLRPLGFTIVDTMKTSFADTIAIMANAKLIVTGYGGQASYIVFCRPGTEYIELLPDVYMDSPIMRFNDRLYPFSHVKHRILRCPTDFAGRVGHKTDFTFTCDIPTVLDAVKKSAASLEIDLVANISLAG